ncbi:MAG: ROK family protein [Oscillospiraceae bacterium]|nr:ROK family protein [Oscillospiraceae bacterium]
MRPEDQVKLTQQGIKISHLKEIFIRTLRSGGISRAQLKREMHLSFPSVSALVDELLASGILEETDSVSCSTRGRPSILLRVCAGRCAIPVVTMQYDGYLCRLYDLASNLIDCRLIPFNFVQSANDSPDGKRYPDMKSLCDPLLNWLEEVQSAQNVPALILSTPGTFNKEGVLTSSSMCLSTPPDFLSYLSNAAELTIYQGNTSEHYAYGEYYRGNRKDDFALILISRGVGAAVVRDGVIRESKPTRAGEFGHISIDYRGRKCICGGRGCLERYISTEVLAADTALDFDALCSKYREGDGATVSFLNERAELLAMGISNMLTIQPVENVVLGGKITLLGDEFLNAVRESVRNIGYRKAMDRVQLRYSERAEDTGALGALWHYFEKNLDLSSFGCI